MSNLILSILWGGSLGGMIFLIFLKRNLIFTLPPLKIEIKKKLQKISQRAKLKIRTSSSFFQLLLQKILMKLRLLSLKLDTKLFNLIQKLKQKSIKNPSNDEYWEKIKKELKK